MPNARLMSVSLAAGALIAGVAAGAAWAGGPDGVVENPPDLYEAVGTGAFEDFSDGPGGVGAIAGFRAYGSTAEEASAAVISACQAAGGADCTADEYTNDNLCIVSVADDTNDVIAGGAGVDVEAARLDALARAAANNTPLGPSNFVVISACPSDTPPGVGRDA
jgi:hypothetical protein